MTGDAELDAHAERIAAGAQGFTVLDCALEPELVDAIHADLQRLEPEIGVGPSDNFFEGLATTRMYNLLAHGELYRRDRRCIGISSRWSSGSSTRAC